MKSESDHLELNNENFLAQRSARNMVKRDAVIVFFIFTIGLILFLTLVPSLAKSMPLYLFLSLSLAYYLLFKMVSNWRGWVALRTFKIHCPHCRQPLFEEKINIFKSPSKKCPNCGQVALVPIKQLK